MVKPKLIMSNCQYVHISHLSARRRHPLPHPIETRGCVASLEEDLELNKKFSHGVNYLFIGPESNHCFALFTHSLNPVY